MQPLKAGVLVFVIVVRDAGIVRLVRLEQLKKVEGNSVTVVFSNPVTRFKLEQLPNVVVPILVNELGKLMLVKLVQL